MAFSFGMTASPKQGNPNPYARPAPPAAPPEIVKVTVCANGIIAVQPPFQTGHAAAIRAFMKARCVTRENTPMLFYRKETNNQWTTMALSSTPSRPELTALPAEAVEKIFTSLTACPEVKQVDMFLEDMTPVTVAQVKAMHFPSLDELASADVAPVEALLHVDALALTNLQDVIIKGQEATERNFTSLLQKTSMKLDYVIDILEGTQRKNDPASRVHVRGPVQTSSAGKSEAISFGAAQASPPAEYITISEPGKASNSEVLEAETQVSSKRQGKRKVAFPELA